MAGSTLDKLAAGTNATIVDVGGEGVLQQRLLEMGLIPGVQLKVIRFAPLGDPMEISLMGYSLSLRRSEAATVSVEVTP